MNQGVYVSFDLTRELVSEDEFQKLLSGFQDFISGVTGDASSG